MSAVIQGYFPRGLARIPPMLCANGPFALQPRAAQPRAPLPFANQPDKTASPRAASNRLAPPAVQRRLAPPATVPPFANGSAANSAAMQLPPSLSSFSRGGGQPMPAAVQLKMEAFFGTSFSDVRVHVGPQAASIGALAFTQGSNLYFAPGQYNPLTPHGQRLLGHELTHVVQQRAGRVKNPFGSGVAVVQDHAMEAEAERKGMQVAFHVPARQSGPGRTLQCSRPQHLLARRSGSVIQPMFDEEMFGGALAQEELFANPSPPKGVVAKLENGVNWYWVENLKFRLTLWGLDITVPVHPLHEIDASSLKQIFYGGYTLVDGNGECEFRQAKSPWYPTQTQHTEPQYFQWLKQSLAQETELNEGQHSIVAIIMEINQTNTPCSGKNCRPMILDYVGNHSYGKEDQVPFFARMSAYTLYYQTGKIGIGPTEAKTVVKTHTRDITLSKPSAIHRIPKTLVSF
jgi:uncharacterized protein DUF4157